MFVVTLFDLSFQDWIEVPFKALIFDSPFVGSQITFGVLDKT